MCVISQAGVSQFVLTHQSWFVVEEPDASHTAQPKHVLCVMKASAKKICPKRWKHTKGFHILKASSKPQACGVRHLFTAHYQVSPKERDSWLRAVRVAERDLGIFVNLYHEGKNYENEFMCMCNEFAEKTEDIVSQFNFETLAKACKAENKLKDARNNYCVDKGFTLDMNTTRRKVELGIAKPNIQTGSRDPVHTKAFQLTSRLAPLVVPVSLRKGLCHDEDREKEFARDLCDGNIVEALRVALTTSFDSVWMCTKTTTTTNRTRTSVRLLPSAVLSF